MENFMQSIIFLRICQYFLEAGLKNFNVGMAYSWNCKMKILMVVSYLVYISLAVYRIVAQVELTK
jgi:hypothetical protein